MGRDNKSFDIEQNNIEAGQYLAGNMDRNTVIALLHREGFRITRQRELLIDIILREECTCCKEIYCLASKQSHGIGVATIYRTMNALEKIGALKRKNPYQLCHREQEIRGKLLVELEDASVVELNVSSLHNVVEKGLKQCGYSQGKRVKAIRHMQSPD
ncbi:MAG: transcriptional repressor [Lachnospiraceae bacterium]|nr:transcriptional repressor [Lachnospiraceae bacterium]